MSELDAFIVRGHQKIIDHYRWLRDTAKSDSERQRYEHRMQEEERALSRFMAQRAADFIPQAA